MILKLKYFFTENKVQKNTFFTNDDVYYQGKRIKIYYFKLNIAKLRVKTSFYTLFYQHNNLSSNTIMS